MCRMSSVYNRVAQALRPFSLFLHEVRKLRWQWVWLKSTSVIIINCSLS